VRLLQKKKILLRDKENVAGRFVSLAPQTGASNRKNIGHPLVPSAGWICIRCGPLNRADKSRAHTRNPAIVADSSTNARARARVMLAAFSRGDSRMCLQRGRQLSNQRGFLLGLLPSRLFKKLRFSRSALTMRRFAWRILSAASAETTSRGLYPLTASLACKVYSFREPSNIGDAHALRRERRAC